ncbi:MAG TPA: exodeoxyribonuclease VII small subunit [Candidatus Dormibacteraeota bacterium]
MSEAERPGLDVLLDQLERAIVKLADGRAPLDQLVDAYEEAHRLAEEAEGKLAELATRLEHTQPG